MSKLKPGARVPAREARRLTNIDSAHPRDAPAAEAPLLPRPQMPRITRVVRRWQSRARSLTTPHTASVGGRRSGNGRSVCSTVSRGFQGKWVISQTLHFSRPCLGSGTRPVLLSGLGGLVLPSPFPPPSQRRLQEWTEAVAGRARLGQRGAAAAALGGLRAGGQACEICLGEHFKAGVVPKQNPVWPLKQSLTWVSGKKLASPAPGPVGGVGASPLPIRGDQCHGAKGPWT